MIELHQLIDAGIQPTLARAFLDPVREACDRFEIDSTPRIAAFIGQCSYESNGFANLEENLRYSDPARIARIFRTAFDTNHDGEIEPEEIEFAKAYVLKPEKLANRAYANRYGNRDEASGDGWKYRGRGGFQLTFMHNYMKASGALGVDYIHDPDQVATPLHAMLTSGWYWEQHQMNELADTGNIDEITHRINMARLGADQRQAKYEQGLVAFA